MSFRETVRDINLEIIRIVKWYKGVKGEKRSERTRGFRVEF